MIKKSVFAFLFCLIIAAPFTSRVNADSFITPVEFEVYSDDGSYVFRWIPSRDYRTAQARVYRNSDLIYYINDMPTLGVGASNFFISRDFMHIVFVPTTHNFQSITMDMRDELTLIAIEFYAYGELIKTHYISDLINDMGNVRRSVTMASWRGFFPETRYASEHLPEYNILRIMTTERIVYTFCTITGEILSFVPYDTEITESRVIIMLNGNRIDFGDARPLVQNGRVLVPVRDVFESMGFTVEWNADLQTVFLHEADNNFYIEITIGAPSFLVVTPSSTVGHSYAEVHRLDVPAQIIGGRTMLPLRAVLESAGYGIIWDRAANTVHITENP